jgi:hypothetical protein
LQAAYLPTAAASLISAMRDDDDDKEFVDKYIDAVIDDAPDMC